MCELPSQGTALPHPPRRVSQLSCHLVLEPRVSCVGACPDGPHECLFCPLFSPRLPPVETVQRNPELVLEGGPLTPLPGDGFLETSIPVPELTWQDGPRPSPGPGCAECV